VYTPAIGPRLKGLLLVILGGVALLGANSVYLASISALEWFKKASLETPFYMLMFGMHLVLGIGLMAPFLFFAFVHLATAWKRPNKAAVRYGLALLAASLVIVATGVVLVRLEVPSPSGRGKLFEFAIKDERVRSVGYWLHVLAPLAAIVLYIRHRMAGPRIKWIYVKGWAASVLVFVAAMGALHSHAPRPFDVAGPKDQHYFFPSEARTADGNFIPARALMMDEYCLRCHQDAYKGWFHSAHHNSSFNNKFYLFSVRETRKVSLKRDGNIQASRWCAGCHDPVPFFSGKFDDPNYDDVNDPTSQSGITCVTCHGITHVNSTRGNADYTIGEAQHYPFAYSDNPVLQWFNSTLVKAKPALHKKTFMNETLKSAEFCSTCHKVSIPYALNHYKDFLRGQNHHDPYLLSGVSGQGARSFYYPPEAKPNCASCHMGLVASNDFGAKDFDGKGGPKIHDHLFLGSNTGLAATRGDFATVEAHAKYLREKKVRIDLFALRDGGAIDGELLGPLRPKVPDLKPGRSYLVEAVVRTLGLGHLFSQGTVDSNEIWVELTAKVGDRVLGRSGGIGPDGTVDPFAHFINVYMLDKDGNRIDRRNPQDIFVPLYNKQIPPGAGQVVHFALDLPEDLDGPVTLEAKINYRKFDRKYLDYVFGPGKGPDLPVVVMASDAVRLPIAGGATVENPPSPIEPAWQRWNDYGIGLLLEGGDKGAQKGELRQAEQVFKEVAEMDVADGWVNLARVYQKEGRVPEALEALTKASKHEKPAAPWVINWLTGQVNERNNQLDAAVASYESVLNTKVPRRGFDFGHDYEVINALANAEYQRSQSEEPGSPERLEGLRRTIAAARRTLAIDSENVTAHYLAGRAFSELADEAPPIEQDDARPAPEPEAAVAEIARRAAVAADPKQSRVDRAAQAHALARTIGLFAQGGRPKFGSKLEPLYDVVDSLGPAWDREADPAIKATLAQALFAAHTALHGMLKPDENAEGRAFRLAKEKSAAANMNSQSIVIHPLHRPAAPGVQPGPVAAREKSK
jgi:tetratricopeptide (TPR) repeat protein